MPRHRTAAPPRSEASRRAGGRPARDRLDGGLAFTPDELRWILGDFTEVEIRPMVPQEPGPGLFGLPVLLTALFRRPPAG
ncbi:hypothetical protein [Kitasatospora sp. NPDC015120]|uniref:hypothetical protein n=1 Tax=Kitasatospora sp. NPDC015120 TaxID=3364023 RepID=UPI0036F4A754